VKITPNQTSKRRGYAVLLVALPVTMLLASCGGNDTTSATGGAAESASDTLDRMREQGYARLAIANEPPYTKVETDGTVAGAEPEIAAAVLEMLGVPEVQGVVTPYASMIPGLQADRWDIITAGLFMKQSRCKEVAYTEPVIVSTESFLVPEGNPKDLESIADAKEQGLKVAILPGAFEEGILKNADYPGAKMVPVPDARSGVDALKAGRAEAFLLPTLSLEEIKPAGFDVTPPLPDAPRTGSGAAFRKEDVALRDAYNEKLAEFKQTPEFAAILTKWGFSPEAVEGVTAEELCKNPG
jgi:polar amino acid transport system substrate-binding protein